VGDVIDAPGCRLVVEALDGMRVSRLRIELEEPAPVSGDSSAGN
jgi:CBS domain containing-hemolysin-like protein